MREGKKQLALWLPEVSMIRLRTLAAEERTTLADILERAIAQFQREDTAQAPSTEGFINAMLDDHEARLLALESRLVTARHSLDKPPEKPKSRDEKSDLTSRDEQIRALHAQGVSGREIARQLRVRRLTVSQVLKRLEIT